MLPLALDDDSSKLAEVLELFSNSRLPLKVDKLVKVSSNANIVGVTSHITSQVSNAWRDKVEQTTPTSHDAKPTHEDGDQPEVEDKPNDLKQVCQVSNILMQALAIVCTLFTSDTVCQWIA